MKVKRIVRKKNILKDKFIRFSYPNLKKIFKNDRKSFFKPTVIKNNKTILFIPTLGIQPSVVIINGFLALVARIRGQKVYILQCDGVLPICQVAVESNFHPEKGLKRSTCSKCFYNANRSFKSTGCHTLKYSEFLNKEDFAKSKKLAQGVSFAQIKNFHNEDVNLGEHIYSGALKFYGRGDMPVQQKAEPILRKYLWSALLTQTVISRVIARESVDVSVFHHGIYIPGGVIGEVCRHLDKVVNWNRRTGRVAFCLVTAKLTIIL